MKKATTKKSTTAPTVKATRVSKPRAAKKEVSIDKVCEDALNKLRELNIDEALQSDLQWCLGSYGYDKNPTGLYQMGKRALAVFTVEKANKTKGVTAKLITDLEKAIGDN